MNRVPLLLFIFLSFGAAAMSQTPAVFHSSYDGKRYDFYVTEEQLKATPAWPDDQDAPPLAPRLALSTARKSLQQLFPDAENWQLGDVTLQPMWKSWIYVVHFAVPPPTSLSTRPASWFNVVVLMNGEPVQPKIVELKPPK